MATLVFYFLLAQKPMNVAIFELKESQKSRRRINHMSLQALKRKSIIETYLADVKTTDLGILLFLSSRVVFIKMFSFMV